MLDPEHGEALQRVFLAEANETLAVLEGGLAGLRSGGEAVLPGLLDPLRVVTHRLRGAAALQGFPGVAQLAGAAEAGLDGDPGATEEGRRRAWELLADLVLVLRGVLDGVERTGREDADAIAAFTARHPGLFVSPPAERRAPPLAAADDIRTPAAARAEALRRDMARFRAGDPGVPAYFTPEALDHLDSITGSLLALEQTGGAGDELGALFRAVHTLKGAAFVVGCTPVGEVAHLMEDVLEELREERVRLAPGVIDALSAGARALRLLLDGGERAAAELPGALERAWAELETLLSGLPGFAEPGIGPAAPVEDARSSIARDPSAPGAAAPQRNPASLRPGMRVELERLESLMDLAGELVIARSRLDRRIFELEHVGELLSSTRARVARVVKALEETRPDGRGAEHRAAEESAGLGPEPFAALVAELDLDRYGDAEILFRGAREIAADLVEVQAELVRGLRRTSDESRRIQRLTGSVRREIVRAKMTPVGRLFARIRRQVRETARAAGRSVHLEVSGEAVELDNAVIAEITDPLLHLVQNAITHGIETEDERRARGKPSHGTITLAAGSEGNLIAIEVRDDGRGIDVEWLKERAVRQGLLPVEVARLLDQAEALDLIFLPGLSTAPLVTSRAGRGVGMDVVRTNLGRLNGEIRVETERGVGTRFTLRLPLTTVVSEALMVRVGSETFAVPLAAVRKVLRVGRDAIESVGPAQRLRLDDLTVDLIHLDRLFGLTPPEPAPDAIAEPMPVIVLRAAGRPLAVGVGALLGKAEIVIKALGPFLDGVGPFGGATISAEGRVILVLDPGRLVVAGRGGAPAAAAPTLGRALAERLRGSSEAAPVRPILLVDDSVSVRKYVGHLLESAGFRVVTAGDGAEALERVEETAFAAVITDLEMPRINGFELIRALRRRPATQDVPVVVLTTRAGAKHLALARWLGIEHYLPKPVDEEAFVQLMAGLAGTATDQARPR